MTHFTVAHGKLSVKVPADVYSGDSGEIDLKKATELSGKLMDRYPWLSENACQVILENGRIAYLEFIDEKRHGVPKSLEMERKGDVDGAVAHLKRHLERNPYAFKAWYALGGILCRAGRAEEGYEAIARGRSL